MAGTVLGGAGFGYASSKVPGEVLVAPGVAAWHTTKKRERCGPMNIRIDTEARALYVEFRHDKVARTVEFAPETFVDLDTRGRLLGVEVLNPGTLEVQIQRIAKRYTLPGIGNRHVRAELRRAKELLVA